MCDICGDPGLPHQPSRLARRGLLSLAGASLALSGQAFARETKAPPKPANVLTPDQALVELMDGNHRYVVGLTRRHDFRSEREALAVGQNPYAGLLSCADSRVAPEFAFDSFRGDLFVCRVAGNFLNDDNLASFEYGVAVLKVPLIMVLGHAGCGAVSSTIKTLNDNTTLPGHLPLLVESLTPAVKDATGKPGDLLENATKANVRLNVERMKAATPILSEAVQDGKLRVVGGYYNLTDGKVEIVA